jgi:hypothetical protein
MLYNTSVERFSIVEVDGFQLWKCFLVPIVKYEENEASSHILAAEGITIDQINRWTFKKELPSTNKY